MNIERARTLYGEIVDEARDRDILEDEQRGTLPVAEIANGEPQGEVRVIKYAERDYRVVWNPPEEHVGQDIAIDESAAAREALDLSTLRPDEAIQQILG